jgi:trichohyalin
MKYLKWINQTINLINKSFKNLFAIKNKEQGIDEIKEKIVKHKILEGEISEQIMNNKLEIKNLTTKIKESRQLIEKETDSGLKKNQEKHILDLKEYGKYYFKIKSSLKKSLKLSERQSKLYESILSKSQSQILKASSKIWDESKIPTVEEKISKNKITKRINDNKLKIQKIKKQIEEIKNSRNEIRAELMSNKENLSTPDFRKKILETPELRKKLGDAKDLRTKENKLENSLHDYLKLDIRLNNRMLEHLTIDKENKLKEEPKKLDPYKFNLKKTNEPTKEELEDLATLTKSSDEKKETNKELWKGIKTWLKEDNMKVLNNETAKTQVGVEATKVDVATKVDFKATKEKFIKNFINKTPSVDFNTVKPEINTNNKRELPSKNNGRG